ncbi:S8 family peptidase [Streptomyces sp. NPDC052052]|uniref:S8 family peptidase n=1 Tax=Streptomyces sp. NPDC052052 TaxID=3154756 RepID=UPI00341FC76C
MKSPTSRRIRAGALLAAVVTTSAVISGAGPAAAGAASQDGAAATADATMTTVPLITGDTARVWQLPDGRQSAELDPGPGRAGTHALITQDGDDLTVVPFDALPLLESGQVDPELFNVSSLIEQGYADGAELPLIVQSSAAGTAGTTGSRSAVPAAGSVPVPDGLEPDQVLDSIGAVAGTTDSAGAAELWKDLTATSTTTTSRAVSSAGGIRVWLDRKVQVTLDQSVPQIGAPEAWQAGYDGSGVKVAVLDTGVDTTHPDLKDAVVDTRNFTTAKDAVDHQGHGTHVASTVAGSGAASDGSRKGVAPGAEILAGKVLGNDGSGQTSWIIAGMEWAADSGARLISMSLGGPASSSEVYDPLVEAVNQISADSGALFVIAAGNDGGAVSSPGIADAALTVGAVDKNEAKASWSNFGPRIGDNAVKPDITAPGVSIVAARAAGTSLGTPVDSSYTSLSGTSMATPHVAGAAALLAQEHPSWKAPQLKAALMSAAQPSDELTAWQQGAGRVDVARAVRQQVTVDGNVSFGLIPYAKPYGSHERTLVYRNDGDQPVTLMLAGTIERTGADAGNGFLRLSADEVTVPAGGDAKVTATFTPQAGDQGSWAGQVVATADGGLRVVAGVGAVVQQPMARLTATAEDRTGAPAAGYSGVRILNLDTETYQLARFEGHALHLDLIPGRYSLWAWTVTPAADGSDEAVSLHPLPELTVGDDPFTLDFDANDAVEMTARADRPTERERATIGLNRNLGVGSYLTDDLDLGSSTRIYVQPTDQPVTVGEFQLVSQWLLAEPGKGTATARYTYDLVFVEHDQVGRKLSYRADASKTATLHTRYFAPGGAETAKPQTLSRFALLSGPYVGYLSRQVTMGQERTEYVTAGAEVGWQDSLWLADADGRTQMSFSEPTHSYAPGERRDLEFGGPIVRPALDITGTFVPTRIKDSLRINVPEWVDGSDTHRTRTKSTVDTSRARLYRNGELTATTTAAWGAFTAAAEKATYRLELDVDRNAEWWTRNTSTRTAWTFTSERSADGASQVLPMLTVDYDLPKVQLDGTVRPHEAVPLTVSVRRPAGAAESPVEKLTVEFSYDDGATWAATPGKGLHGSARTVAVKSPAEGEGNGFVALRVKAEDQDGNAFEQTVLRVYRIA